MKFQKIQNITRDNTLEINEISSAIDTAEREYILKGKELFDIGSTDEALECFQKAFEAYHDLRWNLIFGELYRKSVSENELSHIKQRLFHIGEEASYYCGLCHYRAADFAQTAEVLSDACGEESTRKDALTALCLRKLRPYHENYRSAYIYMQLVQKDEDYTEKEKSDLEEKIYAQAMMVLSEIYRYGEQYEKKVNWKSTPHLGLAPDEKRADELLYRTLSCLKNEKTKDFFRE